MPPPAPGPKNFQVFWKDNDRPVSDYLGITGSSMNGPLLVLKRYNREFIVNMNEVRLVVVDEMRGDNGSDV
jgi:hypothetical protein